MRGLALVRAAESPGAVLRLARLRRKVDLRIVPMPVPAQEGARDGVTVRGGAVVWFEVTSPVDAIVPVEDRRFAVSRASLRFTARQAEADRRSR
ncbi:hypothetical protein [Streptomyces sp. NPDC057438]|uniref:hypothetical protein n=1 Tax=Streptomyces sp. NPDC057438 TaxID=3346133 RepID=UPI00368BA22C